MHVLILRRRLAGPLTLVIMGALSCCGWSAEPQPTNPRDQCLAAMSKKLGRDPQRHYEWVRDQIGYECYAGLLRGPVGTLWARAGNSLDRACLLAELLRRAGHECRIARGRLPRKDAQHLILSMFPVAGPRLDVSALLTTDKQLVALLSRMSPGTDVRTAVNKLPQSHPDADPTLLAEAQDHFWVELRKGEQWQALDAAFRRMEPGMRKCEADSTFETVPRGLRHTLTIQVVADVGTPARSEKQVVLTKEFTVSDLPGTPICFTHRKGSSANGDTFQPILHLGDAEYVGKRVYAVGPSGARLVGERVLFEAAAPGQEPKTDPYVVLEPGEKRPIVEVLDGKHTFIVAPGLMGPEALKQERLTAPVAQRDAADQAPTLPFIGKLPAPRKMRIDKNEMEAGPGVWEIQEKIGHAVFMLADRLAQDLAGNVGAAAYPERARVIAVRTGSIGSQFVANDVRPVVRPGQPEIVANSLRFGFGLTADMGQTEALRKATGQTPHSATNVLAAAHRAKIPLQTYTAANRNQVEKSKLSPAMKKKIHECLDQGQQVFAPELPVSMADGNQEAAIVYNPKTGQCSPCTGTGNGAHVTLKLRSATEALEGVIMYGALQYNLIEFSDSVTEALEGGMHSKAAMRKLAVDLFGIMSAGKNIGDILDAFKKNEDRGEFLREYIPGEIGERLGIYIFEHLLL